MNYQAGSLGGRVPSIRFNKPSVLSLVLNNVCPLSCAHCYLQPEDSPNAMKSGQWLRFIESLLADLPPDVICFSGKEVFALKESAEIFFEALRMRDELQAESPEQTAIGFISNGVLLSRYQERLLEHQPDWIDISIDGLEQTHDAVRGKGSFARMADNLPWLVEMMGDRLWITPTLMETNVDILPEMIDSLHAKFGVKRFSIGLYRPQTYTSPALRIPDAVLELRVLRSLRQLGSIGNADGVEVCITFDAGDIRLRKRFEAEGLIPTEGILRTSRRTFENGLTLGIYTMTVPVGLWRAVRVTNQGQWVAAEDMVNAKEYGRRAAATLADFDYDARRLYRAGLAHVRFQELFGMTPDSFFTEMSRAA